MNERIKKYYDSAYKEKKPSQHEWVSGTANPELVSLVFNEKIPNSSKILEIGCGIGSESTFLAVRGMNVTAMDISESAIQTATKIADLYGVKVHWKVGNILTVDLLENHYDVITDQGCFHHLSNDEREIYVKQVNKALKPGGMLLIRGFSDKMKYTAPQPRLLTSDDLINTFHDKFVLEKLERVLSFSTETRHKPLGWFSIWYKRE
ncbi:class I SAM-dependent methyltransferase [Enterococcus sp. UD-01]|jgi:2-polyprenyl-3-methyl-5-hydroxy-6-metoxy-1,4-benzoquinol methylase|uniref:class I SAM-dependent methyltransferase n=1 Tax=Enterococcus sp. UD-01 TaxID=3373911 RepID=UPI0038345C06